MEEGCTVASIRKKCVVGVTGSESLVRTTGSIQLCTLHRIDNGIPHTENTAQWNVQINLLLVRVALDKDWKEIQSQPQVIDAKNTENLLVYTFHE